MRSFVWKVPCLLWFTAFSACSGGGGGTGAGGSGGGTGGEAGGSETGGSGGAGGTGGGETGGGGSGGTGGGASLPAMCPANMLTAGACVVPVGGFTGDPPETLELVATVKEIGSGAPPAGCWESPAKLATEMAPPAVWARLEDEGEHEWVVAFSVPALEAGFNGHVAVGDGVQVSLGWKMETGGLGATFLVGDVSLSKNGSLVAYVSEGKAPAWVEKGDAVCFNSAGCCGYRSFDAEAEVNGAAASVPFQETVEVGGLAISNISWTDIEDLGCCNYAARPIHVAAAALP